MSSSTSSEWRWFESLRHDLHYAFRSLRRAPGFSLAVLCTLVVCVGPKTAILSALDALVLKPLPFPEPRQLIVITNVADKSGGQIRQSSLPQYLDFKANADLFTGFAVIRHQNITLDGEDSAMRVPNDWVSADFFDLLGVKPLRGRFFTPEEEMPGRNNVLVLSYDFWVSHYHADPGVIGREILSAGNTYSIIGVAPPSLAELSKPTCFFQPNMPQDLFLSRSMRALLFDVTPADPTAYLAVCGTLLVVASLASWLPARRAARVDPIVALRAEQRR